MKKFWIIFIAGIIIFAVTYFITNNMNKIDDNNQKSIVDEKEIVKVKENKIEENKIENNVVTVNSSNILVSPNCEIIMQKQYLKCNHTMEEKIKVPNEVINMNAEELKLYYNEWKLEKFTPTNIVLSRTYSSSCDEHYLLKEDDGFLTVYKEKDNGDLEEYEETEIYIDFLTEEDKIKLKQGIQAVGKEKLNSLLEDFE